MAKVKVVEKQRSSFMNEILKFKMSQFSSSGEFIDFEQKCSFKNHKTLMKESELLRIVKHLNSDNRSLSDAGYPSVKDLISVKIDNNALYKSSHKGLNFNGTTYKRLLTSSGSVRINVCANRKAFYHSKTRLHVMDGKSKRRFKLMAKREDHAGTISKVNGKDLYMGRIQLGYTTDGKPNRKAVYGKTKAEVGEKMRALAFQFGAGRCYDPSKMTVKEWMTFWMENFKKLSLKPKTFEVYRQVIDCHIVPSIGLNTLKALTTIHLQRLVNEKFQSGFSTGSIRKMHNIISSSLEQALQNDMLLKNPAKAVKLPIHTQKAIKFFTESEQIKFFEEAKADALYPLFVLATHTGLRIGEILALNWNDIDFENGIVSVTKNMITVEDLNGETDKKNVTIVQDTPKTKSSIQKIPLSDTAIQVLKDHKQNSTGLLVFCTKNGTLLNVRNVERSFYRIVEKAGIEKCSLHTLRHTFATRLFEKGIPAKVVSEFLGHSKVGHTLDIYTHCTQSIKSEAIKVLDM